MRLNIINHKILNNIKVDFEEKSQHKPTLNLQVQNKVKTKSYTKLATTLAIQNSTSTDTSNLITGPGPATLLHAVTHLRTILCPS